MTLLSDLDLAFGRELVPGIPPLAGCFSYCNGQIKEANISLASHGVQIFDKKRRATFSTAKAG